MNDENVSSICDPGFTEVIRQIRTGQNDPVNTAFWKLNQEQILSLALTHSAHRGRVLDLGCGSGQYVNTLNQEARECYGLDPLWDLSLIPARRNAALNGLPMRFVRGSGENIPFRDDSFDMVLCLSTLQHVQNARGTLDEIRRVLTDNGFLLVSVPQTIRTSTMKQKSVYTMHFNRGLLTSMLTGADFIIRKEVGCGFLIPILQKLLLSKRYRLSDERIDSIVSICDRLPNRFPLCASSLIVLAQVRK